MTMGLCRWQDASGFQRWTEAVLPVIRDCLLAPAASHGNTEVSLLIDGMSKGFRGAPSVPSQVPLAWKDHVACLARDEVLFLRGRYLKAWLVANKRSRFDCCDLVRPLLVRYERDRYLKSTICRRARSFYRVLYV